VRWLCRKHHTKHHADARRDYDLGFPTRDSLVRKEWRG
jgi:hypothetical protein